MASIISYIWLYGTSVHNSIIYLVQLLRLVIDLFHAVIVLDFNLSLSSVDIATSFCQHLDVYRTNDSAIISILQPMHKNGHQYHNYCTILACQEQGWYDINNIIIDVCDVLNCSTINTNFDHDSSVLHQLRRDEVTIPGVRYTSSNNIRVLLNRNCKIWQQRKL